MRSLFLLVLVMLAVGGGIFVASGQTVSFLDDVDVSTAAFVDGVAVANIAYVDGQPWAAAGGASPAFVDYAVSNTTNTTISPTLPTHSEGDMLVMLIYYDDNNSNVPTITGWTHQANVDSGSGTFRTSMDAFTKIAGTSESSPSITFSSSPHSAYTVVIVSVSDATTVDDVQTNSSTIVNFDPFNAPSVTTSVDDALVLVGVSNKRDDDVMTAGITNILGSGEVSPGSQGSAYAGYFTQGSFGATGVTAVTSNDGSNYFRPTGITIAVY